MISANSSSKSSRSNGAASRVARAIFVLLVLILYSSSRGHASTNNANPTNGLKSQSQRTGSFVVQKTAVSPPSTIPRGSKSASIDTASTSTSNVQNDPSFVVPARRNNNGTEVYYMTASTEEQDEDFPISDKLTDKYDHPLFSMLEEFLIIPIANEMTIQNNFYPAAVVVGIATAMVGLIYSRALAMGRHLLWNTIPTKLFVGGQKSIPTSMGFIVSMTTIGGLLMGYLSTNIAAPYSASDFVTISSYKYARTTKKGNNNDVENESANKHKSLLPSAKQHLFPLLGMCLLTSIFGIPLGPEAPMVGAGTLIGGAIARYFMQYQDKQKNNLATHQHPHDIEQILAYTGAAGALTATMGIPIVGGIFALEMTQSNAGMSPSTSKAMSPSIVASLIAFAFIRLIVHPTSHVGGHFDYVVSSHNGNHILGHLLTGRTMMITAILSGIGGACLGTAFHKLYVMTKHLLWDPPTKTTSNNNAPTTTSGTITKRRKILTKTCIGLVIGLICALYPQSLFWGEGSLQSYIDGQQTAFHQTHHGLPSFLYHAARVNPTTSYTNSWSALQVGFAKFVAIVLASAGKFSGGIVFPLFAASPAFAHALVPWLTKGRGNYLIPVAVMCTMAATQASATRTPLASALILALTASGTTELSVLLPACLVSSYLSIFVSKILSKKSYFHYHGDE